MDYGKEFRKYATMHKGMSGMAVDNYIESSIRPMRGMTPYILEERQMNVQAMDVFSRLMMDRIIFLGTAIDDHVANIVHRAIAFFSFNADANKRRSNLLQLLQVVQCVCWT